MRILCIGEVMAEISGAEPHFAVGFAGDTFNTAVYLRRCLGSSAQVAYLTRLGHDPLSSACRNFAKGHGLDFELTRSIAETNIGIYAIALDPQGERSFSYWRSNSAARTLFSDPHDTASLTGFDLIYLSGISLAILPHGQRRELMKHLRKCRAEGARIAFDSNYRPALWEDRDTARHMIAEAWRFCDIALPSLDDELALFADAGEEAVVQRLNGYGCTLGTLKRGPDGPRDLATSVPHTRARLSLSASEVVDTTAAGDSFNAGYLAALLQGHSCTEALIHGHALAAQVIAQRGAIVDTHGAA